MVKQNVFFNFFSYNYDKNTYFSTDKIIDGPFNT